MGECILNERNSEVEIIVIKVDETMSDNDVIEEAINILVNKQ